MSSIWSSAGPAAGYAPGSTMGQSPFASTGSEPAPGGVTATKMQSLLQTAQKSTGSASPDLGLPTADASSGAGNAAATASTPDTGISANDFLTLLVTEMQNQDPTAQTDPNEYINQLVQINSLEQLISINQNLETVLGAATSPASPTPAPSGNLAPASGPTSTIGGLRSTAPWSSLANGLDGTASGNAKSVAHGNLSAPKPTPAAGSLSHALDGHTRAARQGHGIRDIPNH